MDPEVVSYRSTPPAPTPDEATSRWERFQAKHPIMASMTIGALAIFVFIVDSLATIYCLGYVWLALAPRTAPAPCTPLVTGVVALATIVGTLLICFLVGSLVQSYTKDSVPS